VKSLSKVAAVLAALSFHACGGYAQVPVSDLVVSSDPQLAELGAKLLPDLAKRSGLELKRPVRIERRTRGELERYLRFKLDEEMPPERARSTVEAYSLLGLVPDTLHLRAMLLSVYTEQVAGFYEPDSTALFVLDDQPASALQGLLLHELVHAVQDQTVDLSALTDPRLDNDRRTAAQAAIEGQATLVMLEYLMEQRAGHPIDLGSIPDMGSSIRSALSGMRQQFPELAAAPAVIRDELLFPYEDGTGYVEALWRKDGDHPAPFGRYLPRSTEQVVTHDLADTPVELSLTPPPGVKVLRTDVLGRLDLGILLDAHLGNGHARLAGGWGGDRYALLADSGGGRSLVWFSVWDDAAARDRFVRALEGGLSDFGAPATLSATEVDGRPGAVLRVGAPPAVSAHVSKEIGR